MANDALLKQLELLTAEIRGQHGAIEGIQDRLEAIQVKVNQIDAIQQKINVIDSIDRRVSAIESFPVPYGRPRTFHSATEVHSVSNPVRTKTGRYG